MRHARCEAAPSRAPLTLVEWRRRVAAAVDDNHALAMLLLTRRAVRHQRLKRLALLLLLLLLLLRMLELLLLLPLLRRCRRVLAPVRCVPRGLVGPPARAGGAAGDAAGKRAIAAAIKLPVQRLGCLPPLARLLRRRAAQRVPWLRRVAGTGRGARERFGAGAPRCGAPLSAIRGAGRGRRPAARNAAHFGLLVAVV